MLTIFLTVFSDATNNLQTGTIDFAMDEMVKFVSEVTQPNQRQVIQWVGMDTD
jgi:hypothetical protein